VTARHTDADSGGKRRRQRGKMSGSASDRGEITMRTMRIAVAGATRNIGARTVAALERVRPEYVGNRQ
jgi:hypothetical protein